MRTVDKDEIPLRPELVLPGRLVVRRLQDSLLTSSIGGNRHNVRICFGLERAAKAYLDNEGLDGVPAALFALRQVRALILRDLGFSGRQGEDALDDAVFDRIENCGIEPPYYTASSGHQLNTIDTLRSLAHRISVDTFAGSIWLTDALRHVHAAIYYGECLRRELLESPDGRSSRAEFRESIARAYRLMRPLTVSSDTGRLLRAMADDAC